MVTRALGVFALLLLVPAAAQSFECRDIFSGDVRYWTTSPLLDHYAGESAGREIEVVNGEFKRKIFFFTRYFSEKEASQYEVEVREGRLVDRKGHPLDTRYAMIFVMTPTGKIYASNRQQVGIFHHSSFVRGEPVAAAGEFWVHDGVLERISNRSGHYQPSWKQMRQFIQELERRGANVPEQAKETFDAAS